MKIASVIKLECHLKHTLVMNKIEIWRENGAYQEVVSDNG